MAVLVEAFCVVVRADAILSKVQGGWNAFQDLVPNSTLCADGEIARVGFMNYDANWQSPGNAGPSATQVKDGP